MSDPHLQHLTEINRIFADGIKTADQKAAYIFTFLLALLFWSGDARTAFSWRQFATLDLPHRVLSVVLAVAVSVAIVSAVVAVLPRSRPGRTVFFWGAWPAAGERLVAARDAGDAAFLYEEYRRNTETLASICQSKYRMVTLSLRALLVALAAYALLLVIQPAPA